MSKPQGKRALQKIRTRQLLLETARSLFIRHGFLKTTTIEIAKQAGVAHGTLFLHFPTKDQLVTEIIDTELEAIGSRMYELIHQSFSFETLLENYLLFVQEREALYSVLARELPFYDDTLRRKILYREALIRSHFSQAAMVGISQGKYRPCNVQVLIISVFGLINYYLALKPVFADSGQSVIPKLQQTLNDLVAGYLLK